MKADYIIGPASGERPARSGSRSLSVVADVVAGEIGAGPMPANTDTLGEYAATRARRHPNCWVCAPLHGAGLAVRFEAGVDGVVTGVFHCHEEFLGYPGFLHGGVASALLDGAMTNCLMARGTPGLTARLEVRFLKPVLIGRPVMVRGWWEKSHGSLHMLAADLSQDGKVLATATGKFMDYPE